jgi:hypothetical protein
MTARAGLAVPKGAFRPPFTGRGVKLVDAGIRRAVRVLWEHGVETTQSCEGGDKHSFPEPTIRFTGTHAAGFWALGIAFEHGLSVSELRRVWIVLNGEPVGPEWEMTFFRTPALRDDPA